jgi:hypothetical protein
MLPLPSGPPEGQHCTSKQAEFAGHDVLDSRSNDVRSAAQRANELSDGDL